MNTLKSLKKNIYLVISVMALASLVAIPCAYSGGNDNQYADDSLQVCGPGYLNVGPNIARRQAEDMAAQQRASQGNLWKNAVDYIMGKTGNQVEQEHADVNKPKPVLQQKQSSGGKAGTATKIFQGSVTIGKETKINMGTGESQVIRGGKVISEYINGIKFIYAGFTNFGFAADGTTNPIQEAVNMSRPGDVIMVCTGTYNGNLTLTPSVNMFCGFDDTGQRHAASAGSTFNTTIEGNIDVYGTAPTTTTSLVQATRGGVLRFDSKGNPIMVTKTTTTYDPYLQVLLDGANVPANINVYKGQLTFADDIGSGGGIWNATNTNVLQTRSMGWTGTMSTEGVITFTSGLGVTVVPAGSQPTQQTPDPAETTITSAPASYLTPTVAVSLNNPYVASPVDMGLGTSNMFGELLKSSDICRHCRNGMVWPPMKRHLYGQKK